MVRAGGEERALGGPRRRALVARLALDANRGVLAARLVEDLWDGEPPPAALPTLHSHISALRKVIESSHLRTGPDGYVLVLESGALDAARFEGDLADARSALDAGDPAAAVRAFSDGLACWRGPALADAGGAAWALGAVARLDELRAVGLEGLLEAHLALGHHLEVVARAEALVAEHPLRERLWGHLIRGLYRAGRQADALRAYQRLRHVLNDELGLEPGPELRALEAAVLAQDHHLDWAPARPVPAATPSHVPAGTAPSVPARLAAEATLPLVGRRGERERLTAELGAVRAGARRTLVIAGEPGIGKTRLAVEIALAAHEGGARVLYGRCDEDLGLPYQPYVEILEQLAEQLGPEKAAEHLAGRGHALARLLPPSQAVASEAPPVPPSIDGEDERYLLFGAMLDLLMAAVREAPVVIVLDDLQWADPPTVLLTRFLVTAPAAHHLLIVVTHRAAEMPSDAPLARFLGLVQRDPGCTRVALEGLDRADLAELCARALGDGGPLVADRALSDEVWAETDGNPFFALELVRYRAEETRGVERDRVPREVRDVIDVRAARLGEACRRVLAVAAVVGREFETALVADAVDLGDDDVLDALERATAAALVGPVGAERFSFVHALVQEAMYENLSPARRARVHHRVAEAIERQSAGGDARIGEIATHWSKALAADAPRAADAATRAGRRALAQFAPDEAARWFGLALDMLERTGELDGATGDLLVDLGEAQRQSGDAAFRDTLLDAARRAQARGDTNGLVRAALANNRGFQSMSQAVDDERVEMIEAALGALGDAEPVARARLLALLAVELVFAAGDDDRRHQLSDEAVALARGHDDPVALLQVLNLRFPTVFDLAPNEREASSAEAIALADRLGEPVGRFWAYAFGTIAAVTAGRGDDVDHRASVLAGLAEHVGRPTLRWMASLTQAWVAALHGDLDEAERLAGQVLDLGNETGQPDAVLIGYGLLADVAWMRGHSDELVGQYGALYDTAPPGQHAIAAPLAHVLVATGQPDRAHTILRASAQDDFASVRRDTTYLPVLHLYAETAAWLGDRDVAAVLYRLLLPARHEVAFHGYGVNGSTEHVLGVLAVALGRDEEADDHFARAEEVHRRLRAPFLRARTLVEWGGSLAGRAAPEQRERGVALLEEAAAIGRDGGFLLVERHAEVHLGRRRAPAASGELGHAATSDSQGAPVTMTP